MIRLSLQEINQTEVRGSALYVTEAGHGIMGLGFSSGFIKHFWILGKLLNFSGPMAHL